MPVVTFSLLRLGLLAVSLGVLWLVGLRSWLLVVVATVVALALSYLFLARQRDAAARYLAERSERRRAERAERAVGPDEAAEDALG